MKDPAWIVDFAERVWFCDSWTLRMRSVVLLTLLLTMPPVILIYFEEPFILVVTGSLLGSRAPAKSGEVEQGEWVGEAVAGPTELDPNLS